MSESLVVLNYARALRESGDPSSRSAFDDAQKAAEKAGNWETLYHAYAGVGKLHLNRCEPSEAAPWYREALRIAEKGNLRFWLAPALHDVWASLIWAGEEVRSHGFLKQALDRYTSYEHPRAFALIHDMEAMKLIRGEPVGVHGALRSPLAYGLKAADLLLPFGNLLRAAGTAQNTTRFYGWLGDFKLAASAGSGEGVALALLSAARGAQALDDPAEAITLLEHSRRVASARGEHAVLKEAESLLARLRNPTREGAA